MSLPETPASRHAAVAGDFGRLVAQTVDWSAPAPVDGWTARDVVGHLVDWFPGFLAGGGIELPAGTGVADDPVAAWLMGFIGRDPTWRPADVRARSAARTQRS